MFTLRAMYAKINSNKDTDDDNEKEKENTNKRFWGGNFSCRHPKLWEYIKSNVKAFFITGAIVFTISASATTVRILHSRQVRYKNERSVESAINELYQKAEECKRQEMTKIGCDGCIKLEYLEGTGTQYIDTGIITQNNLNIRVSFQTLSVNKWQMVLGANFGIHLPIYNDKIAFYGNVIN